MKQYERRNNHTKLNMTMIALVVSIIVLVMAAFAWFVLSTNPEIKGMNFRVNADQAILVSQDGKDFSNSEDLSEKFADVGALVPSSTVDGLNWFVCKYDLSGNVLQKPDDTFGTQFQYLRFPNGGNVANATKSEGSASGSEDGNTSQQAGAEGTAGTGETEKEKCYYIYTDIWLKTQEDETEVYLSVPSNLDYGKGDRTENDTNKPDETEKDHYGSYVMSYHVDKDENGKKTIQLTDRGSETCARVGFQVLDEKNGDNEPAEIKTSAVTTNNFYIYEPNADRRSEADKTSDEYNADEYVAGFNAKEFFDEKDFASADGSYIPTFPIQVNEDTLKELGSALKNITGDYDDTVTKWNFDGEGAREGFKGYDGNISVFPADHLLAQRSSTWKQPTDAAVREQLSKNTFNSTMIGSMGRFLVTAQLYGKLGLKNSLSNSNNDYSQVQLDSSDESARSTGPIVTLTKNTPQKIRLYFWLEGQDVDCWNDVADTDFLVNLEFVGVPKNK